MIERAWLHRRGRKTWLFELPSEYVGHLYSGHLMYRTNKGTIYAIIDGHCYGKPYWIGRLIENAWCTYERILRAESIEFENGGRYIFPD